MLIFDLICCVSSYCFAVPLCCLAARSSLNVSSLSIKKMRPSTLGQSESCLVNGVFDLDGDVVTLLFLFIISMYLK